MRAGARTVAAGPAERRRPEVAAPAGGGRPPTDAPSAQGQGSGSRPLGLTPVVTITMSSSVPTA
jgi:hypothetical protein